MKLLWALACAVAVTAVSWAFGGPIGAALNAPGVLMVVGAMAIGVLPGVHEQGMGDWIWLGTILSGLFWGLILYVVLGLLERRGRHAVKSGAA